MAIPVNWFGKALLQVSFFNANLSTFASPVDFGYSENGVEFEEREFTSPVYSDENGGQQGVPFDYQVMGEQIMIRIAMSRFDAAVGKTMKRPWSVPLSDGMMQTPGKLIYQDRGFFRLGIGNNAAGLVFPKCTIAVEPKTYNKGTRNEITTMAVLAQGGRISTVVSNVETITWMTYAESAVSLANAWTLLPSTYT
jgi:hypothetical protein